TLDGGETIELRELAARRLEQDPYHELNRRFVSCLKERKGTLLEIGSRARSGNIRRDSLPAGMSYVGLDVKAGDNVDVVGDAHELSELFSPERFDAIMSFATFQHLIMPWKVAIEMNRVLRVGGLVFITSHQTWPMCDVPWDFWRYSDRAWHG